MDSPAASLPSVSSTSSFPPFRLVAPVHGSLSFCRERTQAVSLAAASCTRITMTDAPQLTAVRAAHRFDERALDAYLARHIEGYPGGLVVRQFEGGQSNPTFVLNSGGREYVLRKQPPGVLLPSAHQVDREYRVMDALAGSDVPVPKMYVLCEDPAVIGTKFYVMEKVEGRV